MQTSAQRFLSFPRVLGCTYNIRSLYFFKSQFQLLNYSVTQEAMALVCVRRAFMLNFIHGVRDVLFLFLFFYSISCGSSISNRSSNISVREMTFARSFVAQMK